MFENADQIEIRKNPIAPRMQPSANPENNSRRTTRNKSDSLSSPTGAFASKRRGGRRCWHLLRTHGLSAETEEYVPRVVALILADRAQRMDASVR
jgi:hypothetical protein